MKRMFSFMMAMVLVFSLGVNVSAAGEDGSITITNATIDQTYDLYKFFDATYATDAAGNVIVGANGKAVVSYTIDSGSQFFEVMFGADGTAANTYFNYEASTGVVTMKSSAVESEVVAYLDSLAADATPDKSIKAETDTVVFANIDTGYYLIDRGTTSTVTITSNMPDIEIIDKNQLPGNGFDKLIWNEATGEWESSNSASIGDIVEWEVVFGATNYDGDEIVQYYSIRDIKSSSLWVEFDDIEVSINYVDEYGQPQFLRLEKGYYYLVNPAIATSEQEWEYLGTGWGDIDPANKPDPDEAEWYLIHRGYDDFQIVIPWLDDYDFIGHETDFELNFDMDEKDGNDILSESLYPANTNIIIAYNGSVGPDAPNGAVKNSANLDWVTPENTYGPEDPQETETKVYNMGVTKTANDGGTGTAATRLAGAVFELYRDADCEDPVYVIPTNNEGVYILDDVDTVISGVNRTTSREKYVGYWENYINGTEEKPNPNGAGANRNDMETPANGQLVILGLEAGKYYLKETKAPEGYNQLTLPAEIIVGMEGGTTAVYDNDYTELGDSTKEVKYSVYTKTIVNNQGVELPSTGGEGTVRMITIGTMVAMAFAVLLITHKKMTVYED